MKPHFLLVALAAAQLSTAAAAVLRRRGHQESAGRWRQFPFSADATEPTNASNSSNSSNVTKPPPKCNFTEDANGVIQPANCTSNTSDSCKVIPNMTFSILVNKTNCTPPELSTCQEPDFGELYEVKVDVPKKKKKDDEEEEEEEDEEDPVSHNHSVHGTLSCVSKAAPIDLRFSNQTWGETWYKGPKSEDVWCNNGTWTKPENKFTCATRKQIMLLKDLEHYLKFTEAELGKAEAINFKWIDSAAAGRKAQLYYSQLHAHRMLLEANENLEVPSVKDMNIVLKVLKGDSIIPRGEPMSEATCKDMEKEFSSVTVPGRTDSMPGFTCSYTQQKSATGYDHSINEVHQQRSATFFFRDGCMCESKWAGGCPFKLHYKKPYKTFGFAGLDEKTISKHGGAAYANALCWYWSDPVHPEWGYVNRGANPSTV